MLTIVLAYDGTDSEAPARRMCVRARYLEGILRSFTIDPFERAA